MSPARLSGPPLLPIPVIQLLQVLTVALGAPGVTRVVEMPLMLLLTAGFTWAVSGRRLLRVRRVPAWRSATMGVEEADSYTAFGYANPTRRVLAGVLRTRAELHGHDDRKRP